MLIQLRKEKGGEIKPVYCHSFEPFFCLNMADCYIHFTDEHHEHQDISITSAGDFRFQGEVYGYCSIANDENEVTMALNALAVELKQIRDKEGDESGIAFSGRITAETWDRVQEITNNENDIPSIKFHCPNCGNIEYIDNSVGVKRGDLVRCPKCHKSSYLVY